MTTITEKFYVLILQSRSNDTWWASDLLLSDAETVAHSLHWDESEYGPGKQWALHLEVTHPYHLTGFTRYRLMRHIKSGDPDVHVVDVTPWDD